jgi:LysM repeat protein
MFAKFLIVLVLAGLGVGLVAHSSQGAGPERMYVVRPADTLWSIAARSYAGDVREGVWKLQQRNHLASTTLQPGQRLILPGS